MKVHGAANIVFEPFIDADTRQLIIDGVDNNNIAATGFAEVIPVNFVLRGESGEILGGLIAYIWGGWLHVTFLWISKSLRRSGFGAQLLRSAEEYARSHGAFGAALETFSFQARPFYERCGYRVYGVLEDYPAGHAQFVLFKRFVEPSGVQ